MANAAPDWYDDGSGARRWWDGARWTETLQPPIESPQQPQPVGLIDQIRADAVAGAQPSLGYRLHTITTAASGSKDLGGGDRIQATMVFERLV